MTEQELKKIVDMKVEEIKAIIPEAQDVMLVVRDNDGCACAVDYNDADNLTTTFLVLANTVAAAFAEKHTPEYVPEQKSGLIEVKTTYAFLSYLVHGLEKKAGINPIVRLLAEIVSGKENHDD